MVNRYALINGELVLTEGGGLCLHSDYKQEVKDAKADFNYSLSGAYCRASEAEKENAELKNKIIDMRTRCNKRFYEQLQEIRKLKAANMLQSQDKLFKD